MQFFIGIDPGVSGAMAAIYPNGCIEITPYDEDKYCEMLNKYSDVSKKYKGECICCIEQVHSMPKQGVASTFKFGKNYGIILGMLKAFEIPFQEVPPQRWKKEFSLSNDKQKSIDAAHHLFPAVSLKRTERCRTDDNNIAEALLMAVYAKRKLQGEN